MQKNRTVYLNEHLAGAAAALRLLGSLGRRHGGEEVGRALDALRVEVAADRRVLEELMRRAGVRRSRWRLLAAALGHKLTLLALRVRGSRVGEVHLLLALEGLDAGVRAKRSLWAALAAAAAREPRLDALPYDDLLARADRQLASLQRLHAEQARRALARD